MADINDMTRPLKKYEHGGLHEELPYDRSKSRMENENILMRDIGGTLMDKFKGLFKKKQYEGGDDPEYMKKFNFLWKQGFSERQIRAIMSGEVNQTDIVPERVEYDFDKEKSFVPEGEFRGAKGGLASISQMTRPIHMNNGGETKTATASGMHPLVEWKEIYDAWIIDGGEEMPLWDFIEMMTKGIKKG